MKIKVKKIYMFSVPFNRKIANLNINLSRHVVLILSYNGFEGVGEGVLYKGTTLSAINYYRKIFKPFFESHDFESFEKAREEIYKRFANQNSGLVCAFDIALWNLEANKRKKSLTDILKSTKSKLNITEELFIDNLESRSLSEINKHKTKFLKIKIGQDLLRRQEPIILVLKKFKGQIRADANKAFTLKQFHKLKPILEKLRVREVEEPLKKNDLHKLKNKSGIILDESVLNFNDLKKYLKSGFKIFNLKLSKLGGMTACIKHQREIEKSNGKIIVGSSEELGIGTYSLLAYAASINSLHSVEGLGSERLKFDIVKKPFVIKKGRVFVNNPPQFEEKKLTDASRKFNFPLSVNAQLPPAFIYFEVRENIKGKFKNLWLRIKH